MIPHNTDSKSRQQNSKCHQTVSANTLAKFNPTEKTLLSALVHVRRSTGNAYSFKRDT